jgi:hypothetical protein
MIHVGRQMQWRGLTGIAHIDLSAGLQEQLNGTEIRRLDGQM